MTSRGLALKVAYNAADSLVCLTYLMLLLFVVYRLALLADTRWLQVIVGVFVTVVVGVVGSRVLVLLLSLWNDLLSSTPRPSPAISLLVMVITSLAVLYAWVHTGHGVVAWITVVLAALVFVPAGVVMNREWEE